MKKIIFALAFLLVSNTAFAAWSSERVSSRQSGDTLVVTVNYSKDGVFVEQAEVPIFRPQTKLDVREGIKNRLLTIKDRVNAEARIRDVVKPAVDADTATGVEA